MDRANPAPLGLMGFGMTTVLLNIANAGFFGMDPVILAMGIAYGGLAQVIAGIMEFRKGNTFGTTAFTSYGLFWISFALIVLGLGGHAADRGFLGWYLFLWGLFTAYMFLGTLKLNVALQVVFGTLTILFWILAIGHWVTGDSATTIIKIAGWEGIVCGSSAIYAAAAQVLNEVHGKTVLPLGVVK
jgi:succinate-acetate transporter protein